MKVSFYRKDREGFRKATKKKIDRITGMVKMFGISIPHVLHTSEIRLSKKPC